MERPRRSARSTRKLTGQSHRHLIVLSDAESRARVHDAVTSMHVSTNWDPSAFREYVIGHAKKARVASDQAGLASATGIDSGLLGRWFRGENQPGLANLEKVHQSVPGTTMQELMVLAGRASADAMGVQGTPTAPQLAHPIAVRVDDLLGDASPLPGSEREFLTEMLTRVLERYDKVRRTA